MQPPDVRGVVARESIETVTQTTPADESAFSQFGLNPALVRAVADEGYTIPTPVQLQVVPPAVAGRDVVACAQTGTGKTAAFVLPLLHHLSAQRGTGRIRALILTPTRELAAQIADRIAAYGRHVRISHAVIYGGVGQRPQERALSARPDIVVACPGRLLDLMQQGFVDLGGVTHFVLDEADRMLDMGFVHDVKRIVAKLPTARQTLLLSATMPRSVEALIAQMLKAPARVSVRPDVTTAETVAQTVVFVEKAHKREALREVLGREGVERALVFTRTKHGANRVVRDLEQAGIGARAIHGNKSQSAREAALLGFRQGTTRVLVATDVAARGIDVDGISHVINFDLPNVAESYVHRIGRTGRAGHSGSAISFCDRDERPLLTDIERWIRRPIAVGALHGVAPSAAPLVRGDAPARVSSAPAPPPSRELGGDPARRGRRRRSGRPRRPEFSAR
ncbi:MAG: DEAD/DEAH box helicase [Polyangiaceae bacterium]|nr:DEAD/DEAH box helicase [Polyangiaceae bacterium]